MFVVPYCDLVFDVVVPADVGDRSSTSSFPVVNAGLLFNVWICVIPVIGLRVFAFNGCNTVLLFYSCGG